MFKKTYLSRAMTRAMSLDHPIGDPFGGPAYGERRDPVTAAFAAIAAEGATMAVIVSSAATIATYVGVGLTVVGAVTGNQSMMKLGSILTLVGGVTNLAMSTFGEAVSAPISEAMVTDEIAAAGAQNIAATQGMDVAAAESFNAVGDTVASNSIQSMGTDAITNQALLAPPAQTIAPVANTVAPAIEQVTATNVAPSVSGGITAPPASSVVAQPATSILGDGSVSATFDRALVGANPAQNGLLSNAGATTNYANLTLGSGPGTPPSWLDKIIASPTASMLGVQAIGSTASAFGGYLSAKDQQDRSDALLAKQSYNRDAASRLFVKG